jgi:hypothetical protein
VLRSMLFNLMFIFFSVSDICLFTINVDSKTSTRWKRNSDVETSISSINLLRSKLLISLMRCSLRLFKKNSFKVVRIFVKTSRRFMSDDITSIRAENLFVFQTIDILRDQVINTFKVWLLNECFRFCNHLIIMKKNIKIILLFKITRIKSFSSIKHNKSK